MRFLLTLLVLSACATNSGGDAPSADKFVKIFVQAKQKIDQEKFDKAKSLLNEYLKKSPRGEHVDEAVLYLGQIALRERQFATAENYFNKLVSKSPASPMRDLARFYRAMSWNGQERKIEALADLPSVHENQGIFSDVEKIKFFLFWGKLAADLRSFRDSGLAYNRAAGLAHAQKNPGIENEILTQLKKIIEFNMSATEISSFLQYVDAKSLPAQWAQTRLSDLQKTPYGAATQGATQSENTSSVGSVGPAPVAANIESLPESYGEANRVGLLLPVDNKEKSWGKAIQDGMNLLLKKEQSTLQLFAEDPGSTVDSAKEAYEKLVNDHRVMAVIGPLSGDQALAVARIAESEGVPFISTSPRTQLSWGGSTINFSFDFKKQAEALVKFASENLNAARFAMMFPRDDFGKEFAEAFWAAAVKYKGTFTAIESYPPGQSDFKKNVENMIGLGNLIHSRWKEREDLEKDATDKAKRPLRDKEKKSLKLPPIVDFDVCFIPDSYKVLGQVTPLFAYYDIDSSITLMGPSTWDSPQVISRAGQFLENSVFVDYFSKTSPSELVRDFMKDFQLEYARSPSSLNALGYDIASALDRALKNASSNRKDLLRKLISQGDILGVLGLEKWDSSRDPIAELQVFRIHKNNVNWQQNLRLR